MGPEAAPVNSGNPLVGFGAVLLASVSSGYSSIYFERLVTLEKTSLAMRNTQLGEHGNQRLPFIIHSPLNSFLVNQTKFFVMHSTRN